MRGQDFIPRTTTSHVRQLPTGYVVELHIKRDDGENIRTQPRDTITAALKDAEELAKQAGYQLV